MKRCGEPTQEGKPAVSGCSVIAWRKSLKECAAANTSIGCFFLKERVSRSGARSHSEATAMPGTSRARFEPGCVSAFQIPRAWQPAQVTYLMSPPDSVRIGCRGCLEPSDTF